jgi:hypothetical protein
MTRQTFLTIIPSDLIAAIEANDNGDVFEVEQQGASLVIIIPIEQEEVQKAILAETVVIDGCGRRVKT